MNIHNAKQKHVDVGGTQTRSDKLFYAAFIAGLAILIFLFGSFLTIAGYFPGPQISRAYEGGKALYARYNETKNVYGTDLWYPERRKDKGVTVKREQLMQAGPTVYMSGSEPTVYLIDADGNVLHSWTKQFSEIWSADPDAGWMPEPQPDSHVYIRRAHVFPNGDVVAIYEGAGDTPYGYGVVKLDRNSEVIWSYPGRAHHQFDIGPDGRIYVLTHEFVEDDVGGFAHLDKPRLEDFLVVLSPDGEELKKIRLFTALADSEFRQTLYTISSWGLGDPTHTNTVEYISDEAAANFPFGEAGQIMLSFRGINTIAVLDTETEQIKWAAIGPWLGQHDPDVLPNGNILLFDNFGNFNRPNGISRVIEFDPKTMEIVWQYAGTPQSPLASTIRSDQQRLANGNTLITESDGGRIVEVTPDGEIAWEFVNPVRGGPDGDRIPIMAWTERLDPDSLDPSLLQPRQQLTQ
ncbi:arylsulfotransferase family protein [Chelativorans salis]|uniref:Arylsulfotransferase family protein n=1 Tax=Chelativorans salis TaxID=2978478 RepID=A0ABT2LGQ1_9HYPH|nr:arylsulfotransferase family protein [Chelativorans sp. EGI FJ00035]MCT7373690.1 arylsulfotransferase family protein [Chelativorans sp. EGI FJ00035]